MSNTLAKKHNFRSIMNFTMPTIIMMVFMSLYSIVDGVFVARLVGTNALSAVNIVYPLISAVIAAGIMLATGASAVVAKKMGEGDDQEARRNFTLICIVGLVFSMLFTLAGFLYIEPLLLFLGANEVIYEYCFEYAFPLLFFVPSTMFELLFQYFFVTSGRPNLGLGVTIAGGCTNIVLDYLFIGPMKMGVAGAAWATGLGCSIPALVGLVYFSLNRKGTLYFVKPKMDWKVILQSCTNGASEMVTNMSAAVITYLFNITMMHYMGEDGVAAITIVLYAEFLLIAVYLGYSSGIAPVISYNYGSQDYGQLRQLFKTSMIFMGGSAVFVIGASYLFAAPIVSVFAPAGSPVYAFAVRGFYLYSLSYLFKGVNVFASAMFTAFSNGKISAILSFLRTLVFIVAAMAVLTWFIGSDGVWLAVPLAEVLSFIVSVLYFVKYGPVYRYVRSPKDHYRESELQ